MPVADVEGERLLGKGMGARGEEPGHLPDAVRRRRRRRTASAEAASGRAKQAPDGAR